MMARSNKNNGRLPALWTGLALAALGIFGPTSAEAHFILQAPNSWAMQNAAGLPQKSPPCGQADTGDPAMPTGDLTVFQKGQTITVTIQEVVPHPGHYRVAIAQTQDALPKDPPVVAGATACGSTTIAANPTLPLLADGMLVHTTPFTTPQSMQITLPPDFTCTNCTLQVVEFMSDHPLNLQGGCFYHHCANVTIQSGTGDMGAADAGNTTPADASITGGADAATSPPPAHGCAAAPGRASAITDLGALFALGVLLLRSRRKSGRLERA